MINLKNKIAKTFGILGLTLAMTGCAADGLDVPDAPQGGYGEGTQLVLSIAMPSSIRDAATRAESDPTSDECAVGNMRLLAFGESGGVENRPLPVQDVPVADDRTANFEIKGMQPGNYRVYVVANVPDASLVGVRSEQELRDVVLDWQRELPQAGSLPMVYEPGSDIYIPSETGNTPTVHTLSLQFACVKMRCNVIFDRSYKDTQGIFGDNGFLIKSVELRNVSKSSGLIKNTAALEAGRTVALEGAYYNGYTETAGNANVSNADVVAAQGGAVQKPSDVTKWLWQSDIYLPERYAQKTDEQTTLAIEGYVAEASGSEGNVRCSYTLPLGGYIGGEASKELPRNTYYEVNAHITTLGNAELDASILAKDWMEQNLPADFVHTYLKLSKTVLNVNSLENDEMTYETDGRGSVETGCDTELKGMKVVRVSGDGQTGKIEVVVNHDIDITKLTKEERVGTARCWVKAGNIKKYFTVNYDLHPFFQITPLAVKVQYDNNLELRTKVFEYRTNLGGVMITGDGNINDVKIGPGRNSSTISINGKRVSLTCSDPTASQGTITVVALDNPGTTVFHYLDAYPSQYKTLPESIKAEMDNGGMEDLTVTVMPPLGGYRIYFRAINDYHIYKGGNSSTEFNNPLPEGGENNWIDYWNNSGSVPADDGGNGKRDTHRIYIYTQYGETHGTSITGPVWKFTYDFGDKRDNWDNMTGGFDSRMIPDKNNPGWYYYNLPADKTPIKTENMDKATEQQKEYYNIPRPGETLMIFYNGWYVEQGYSLHRAPHHLDPGILLFDYEDREGWVIYDPTSVPYYNKFDEKPVIENTIFTIYSDKKVEGWYLKYGNASNNVPTDAQRYTVWRNNVSSNWTTSPKGCYKTEIMLKCPKGEYSKGIIIKFQGGVEAEIFQGRAYPNNTGYFNTSTKKWSTSLNF